MRRLLPVDWTVEGLLDETLVELLSSPDDSRWYRKTRDAIDIGRGDVQDSTVREGSGRWSVRRDGPDGGAELFTTSSSWAVSLHLLYEWALDPTEQAALRQYLAALPAAGRLRVAGDDWLLWGSREWLRVVPGWRRAGSGTLLTRMVHAFRGLPIGQILEFVRELPAPTIVVAVEDREPPRSDGAVVTLLERLNPRLLDMLAPEDRGSDDGFTYFLRLGRLAFRDDERVERQVRLTDDGLYWVTSESRRGMQELLVTDSLHALELFLLVGDLDRRDCAELVAFVQARRESPRREPGFEHLWSDGTWMRGGAGVDWLPELVEEFAGHELIDVMDVVEYLRHLA